MSTIWDRAVRSLYPVLGDRKALGETITSPTPEGGSSYYCGGPVRACSHLTCAIVSALAEDDLLGYGAQGVTKADELVHRALADTSGALADIAEALGYPRDYDDLGDLIEEVQGLATQRPIATAAVAYVNGPSEAPHESDGSPGDLGDQDPQLLYGRLYEAVTGWPYGGEQS